MRATLFVLPLGLLLSSAHGAAIRLETDLSQSYVLAIARKGGLLSFAAGHDHAILATQWSADLCFDEANPAAARAAITIQAPSLRIDTEEGRRRAALEGKGPKPDDIKEIQEKMLGPENLAASRYPEIQFRTDSVASKDRGTLVLSGPLTIRGVTRKVSAPIQVERADGGMLVFSGELKVKQSDFGIKPASVGGVVNVKDTVEIRFRIHAKSTAGACGVSGDATPRAR